MVTGGGAAASPPGASSVVTCRKTSSRLIRIGRSSSRPHPRVTIAFEAIEGAYSRLQKLQNKRMEAYTAGEDLQARSEKTYEKSRAELVALSFKPGASVLKPWTLVTHLRTDRMFKRLGGSAS